MGPGSFDPGNGEALREIEEDRMLQWGRGLLTPEMSLPVEIVQRIDAASMGPGSFDPGNARKRILAVIEEYASMGPGSFDPGNSAMNRLGILPMRLQWGRGLLTPEMLVLNCPLAACVLLQWGRGLLTPEIRRRTSHLPIRDRFNGAGVF